ncbi:MAG: hypothetical protein WDZ59_00965 [Pirellulales bacterium]
MDRAQLREQIVAAFTENQYPGDDRLTWYGTPGPEVGPPYDETFQLLRGRSWREMPVEEFLLGDTPIPDLTPEAYHYYMPALLLASLDDVACGDVAFTVTFYLSFIPQIHEFGRYSHEYRREYNQRMALFTDAQREVLIRVLEAYVALGWEALEEVQPTIDIIREKKRL